MKRPFRLTPSAAIFSSALTGLLMSIGGCSDPATTGSTGGAPAAGGAASGGAASGGAASGGAPSGGAASGGAASGGAASGGAASGGAASGGAASGGESASGGGEATGGAATGGGSSGGEFTLTSTDWAVDGAPIDPKFTCDAPGASPGPPNWGDSPQVTWANPPEGTMSYAFFTIDWTLTMGATEDVNGYHSAAWNIPTSITSLDSGWSGADLPGAVIINDAYLGPCPGTGDTDTYHIIVMALPMASYGFAASGTMGVKSTYNTLKDVALATAEITGTYIRE